MRNQFYAFGVSLLTLLFSFPVFGASPTIPASNLSFSQHDGAFIRISWSNGNGSRRIVIARAGAPVTATPVNGTDYLHHNTFASGQQIAPEQYVVHDGSQASIDVTGLQPATTYHFAVYEYNGDGSGIQYIGTAATGNTATLSAPVTQVKNLSFSSVIGNSATLSWEHGSGNKRIVLVRAGSAVNVNPADLQNYTANPHFTQGTQIGSGNYVVYNGSSNSVTIQSLLPNTTYHVAVFEANGRDYPVYLTSGAPKSSFTTHAGPTLAARNLFFSHLDGNSMRVNWTSGNGTKRIVVARAGSPVDAVPVDGTDFGTTISASFTNAPEIAPGQKVIYNHSNSSIDVSGLSPNTTYFFKVFEYDGAGNATIYLKENAAAGSQSTPAPPTRQPSNITFTDVTGSTMTVGFAAGNGSRRLVIAREGGPVTAAPVSLAPYNGSPIFKSGTNLGNGNFVVYSGSGTSFHLMGLDPNTTYHFAAFEANGSGVLVFNTTAPATANGVTLGKPSQPSKSWGVSNVDGNSLRISWLSGNGTRRIVIARAGSPVDAVPEDGEDYLNEILKPFHSAPEIKPGQKVIYDNSGNFLDVTGLSAHTRYYFRVYEYMAGTLAYQTASFLEGEAATASSPTLSSGELTFSNITGNTMTLNWKGGNGSKRVVIARAGSPVTVTPADYTNYSSSSLYGNGFNMGEGHTVVYNGNGTSVNLINLSLNTTYHFAIFEANGNFAPVYKMATPATGAQATASRPTQAPGHISVSNVEGNAFRLTWNSGNGTKRIVIARAGSPVDAVPEDGVDYLSELTVPFSSAPEIKPGQKVLYDNIGSFVDLTGLNPATTYHFRIYEFSGDGAGIAYLTSSFATGTGATLSKPYAGVTNLSFTSVTGNGLALNWTNGNGAKRIVVGRKGSPVTATPADLQNYSSTPAFGKGAQIGTGNYILYTGGENSVNITQLESGTTYHFAVFEYNGTFAPMYHQTGLTGQATTIGPPALPATESSATNAGSGSVQLAWVNGSGNRRMVLMKKGGPVDAVPANNTTYFANSFFSSGSRIGTDNYVVFDGTQEFVTVTNLQLNAVYHFAVYEYNSFGATSQFLTTTPATGNIVLGTLPVRLTEFTATAVPGGILLNWSTAGEERSDRFEIERSGDGRVFTKAGTVQAAGSSSQGKSYFFTDATPAGGTLYYRLKQLDTDGTFEYSKTLQVKATGGTAIQVSSPVRSTLTVRLPSAAFNSRMSIYDGSGKLVRSREFSGNLLTEDVSALVPGVYILELHRGLSVERTRFVKQ